jgi:hypothetical protein
MAMCASRVRNKQSGVAALVCAAAVMTFAGVCGCDSMGASEQAPAASPVQYSMLEGIPLPSSIRPVPERSVGRSTGQLRVGQYEFESSHSVDQVARFFIENMPTARFTLKEKRFDNGEYSLRFESDAEVCNIRAKPAKMRAGRTAIIVDIGPLPKGSAEREVKPAVRPP